MTANKGQVAREHTPLTRAIAQQVKAERNAADLTQQEAAHRAGMSITSYRRVESGERPPTVGQVADIARAVGLDLSELVRRAEQRMATAATGAVPAGAEADFLILEADLSAEEREPHPKGCDQSC